MPESTQQKYYDQHYSVDKKQEWQQWKPRLNLSENQNLSEFKKDFWQEAPQESILATLSELAPFKSILDVGCSTGDFLIPLSRVSNRCYGVDIVEFDIAWELMSREYGINCQKLNLDNDDLPFTDASFDLVTMLMVLEHVFDVHHAVQEVSRVLEPGGLAIIQVPNIAYIKHRLSLLAGQLPCTSNAERIDNSTEWDGQHLHYFTVKALTYLLKQYGLQVQTVKCSGRFGKLRSLWSSLLGADLIVFARKLLV